ncbi:MAG: peptidoglycan endopeptidase [Flavonifractor plautii]
MGRGSGSIRPHLAVLLLLTGVLAGLLLRTPVPSVPTPLPQGEVGERIAAALPAELSPCAGPLWRAGPPWWGGWATSGAASRTRWGGTRAGASRRWSPPRAAAPAGRACLSGWTAPASVSWCAVNAAGDPAAFAAVGNGVRAQRALCAPVDWADALPGDLAFYPDLSHVGIVAGRGEDGGLLVLHCSYSLGGVVCSSDAKAAGFTDLGRPSLFEKTP